MRNTPPEDPILRNIWEMDRREKFTDKPVRQTTPKTGSGCTVQRSRIGWL
jgi:hypothetical protein